MDNFNERVLNNEIDTVRALHQTVVSLRTALERSQDEVKELKVQICLTDQKNSENNNQNDKPKITLRENTTQTQQASMDEQQQEEQQDKG